MNAPRKNQGISRRRFIAATGLTLAAPSILTSRANGQVVQRNTPSNRVTVGVVGWGMQGPPNTNAMLNLPNCQVVAVCDLDKTHLAAAADTVNQFYKNQDCKRYHDYREMMARKDIDAVMLAVPDHWHALVSTEAARQGKHIYGEKPLARTIAEQQAIVQAVQKSKVIWQTGSWQRSTAQFTKAAEIVRAGLLGKVTRVEVGLPQGHNDFLKGSLKRQPNMQVSAPPPELDYETWIGPSKMQPYIEGRVHMNWRWNYNTGGGQLLDWVGHHVDIAHWGLGLDDSGPLEIEGQGTFPAADALWNTATKYRIELKYPDDVHMTIAGGHSDIRGGTKWIGTDGWIRVDRSGFESSNEEWNDWKHVPDEFRKVPLVRSTNHQKNFIDCCISGTPTLTPVEVAHHSAIPGHLGLIAMLVGRKIRWDSKAEKIIGDPEATKLMSREYRAPYKLA